jgi:hypothetical protein
LSCAKAATQIKIDSTTIFFMQSSVAMPRLEIPRTYYSIVWAMGPAGSLYERALVAMHGHGTIDRMKLISTRTARTVATNIGSSIQLPLTKRLAPAFHTLIPPSAADPVKVVPNTPDAAARTSGIRTGRATATLVLCASTYTRNPQSALESVSSIHVP